LERGSLLGAAAMTQVTIFGFFIFWLVLDFTWLLGWRRTARLRKKPFPSVMVGEHKTGSHILMKLRHGLIPHLHCMTFCFGST
jgi:hypothetical protein